jgi:hypothetical protein
VCIKNHKQRRKAKKDEWKKKKKKKRWARKKDEWKKRKELGEKKDEWKKSLVGGFVDPRKKKSSWWVCRPTVDETHGWVSLAVGLDELVPDVLGTAALDDNEEDDDDDNGGSNPNNDCGRFAITEMLKDLRISAMQHLGLFFGFFLLGLLRFEFGFLVFSLIFNMTLATFKVIKCSDFRMKKF